MRRFLDRLRNPDRPTRPVPPAAQAPLPAAPEPLPPGNQTPVTAQELFRAMAAGDLAEFDRLAARWEGAPLVQLRGRDGQTLLFEAVRSDRVAEALARIPGSAAPDFLNAGNRAGVTASEIALHRGHLNALQALGVAGADLNGRRLLRLAIFLGNEPAVSFLMGRADVDRHAADDRGVSALQAAVETGRVDIVASMLREGGEVYRRAALPIRSPADQGSLLHVAVTRGDVPMMDHLIQEGLRTDVQDAAGNTPLHTAVRWGREAAVSRLLQRPEADAQAVNAAGLTAADMATSDAHPRANVVSRLLEFGAVMPARFMREPGDERPFNWVEQMALEVALSDLEQRAHARHQNHVVQRRNAGIADPRSCQDPQLRALVDVYMRGGLEDRAARVEAVLAGPAPLSRGAQASGVPPYRQVLAAAASGEAAGGPSDAARRAASAGVTPG
jgi:ankyrin repeat protein